MGGITSVLIMVVLFLSLHTSSMIDISNPSPGEINDPGHLFDLEHLSFEPLLEEGMNEGPVTIMDFIGTSSITLSSEDITGSGAISLDDNNIRITGFSTIGIIKGDIPVEGNIIIEECGDVFLGNCNFISKQNEHWDLQINRCDRVEISGSSFSNLDISVEGAEIRIDKCSFQGGQMRINNTRGASDITNTTFEDEDVFFESNDLSIINNNVLNRSDLFIYRRAGGVNISENRFFGGRSCLYLEFSYCTINMSEIWSNEFESCYGINMGDRGTSPLGDWRGNNWNITRNYFANCTKTITWPYAYGTGVRIWMNVFYHNMGTGDSGSVVQVSYSESYSLCDVQWYLNGIGNFWQNHRTPDNDSDFIVDNPYKVSSRSPDSYDLYPLVFPFHDFDGPIVEFKYPLPGTYNRSYFRVNWTAFDLKSGLASVHLSVDGGKWREVTDELWWPVELAAGVHELKLKAFDRIGHFNITSVVIEVTDESHPVGIISPLDGEILVENPVRIEWRIDDHFPIGNATLLLDREVLSIQVGEYETLRSMDEGPHSFYVIATDVKNCTIRRDVDFILDLTPPRINISSPYEGATFSNVLMNFAWTIYDLNGVDSVRYRLDKGDWVSSNKTKVFYHSQYLGEGNHILDVETVDIAGRSTRETVDFTIGFGMLNIIEPFDLSITNRDQVEIKWAIKDGFDPVYIGLEHIEEEMVIDVTGRDSYNASLTRSGSNRLIVKAVDAFGNHIQDMVKVIRDIEPPAITIENNGPEVNDRPLIIRWASYDLNAISGYRWRMDDGGWQETGQIRWKDIGEPDEGAHVFQVECIDEAGNRNSDEYRFYYDITPPTVEFIMDDELIVQQSALFEIRWDAFDERGILNCTLSLGDKQMEISPSFPLWEGQLDEGYTFIEIVVNDPAGNTARDAITVLVDTIDPALEWENPVSNPTNLEEFFIGWKAGDYSGFTEVILQEEEIVLWSGSKGGENALLISPDEGDHTYTLTATDISGRISSISRTIRVDRTAPMLDSIDHSYHQGILDISWTSSDEHSSVIITTLDLGDHYHWNGGPNGTYRIDGIDPGGYTIIITIIDEAENVFTFQKEIVLGDKPADEPSNTPESGILLPMIAISLLLILIVISALFLLKNKKWGPFEDDEQISDEIRKIPVDGTPMQEDISIGNDSDRTL